MATAILGANDHRRTRNDRLYFRDHVDVFENLVTVPVTRFCFLRRPPPSIYGRTATVVQLERAVITFLEVSLGPIPYAIRTYTQGARPFRHVPAALAERRPRNRSRTRLTRVPATCTREHVHVRVRRPTGDPETRTVIRRRVIKATLRRDGVNVWGSLFPATTLPDSGRRVFLRPSGGSR